MRRIFLSTLMLLSVVAAATGVSPASAQDKLSVRLDFSPWGVQAAMHLAQNKGWFKEANLDVDIQDGRGSGNTIQLVNAGQADVGQVQVGLVGSARAKGATIRSIATFQRRTDLCILVDKDSPMSTRRRSARQDRGRVRGKSLGALHRYLSEVRRSHPRRSQGRRRRSRGVVGHLYRQAGGRTDVHRRIGAADRRAAAAIEMPAGVGRRISPSRAMASLPVKTPSPTKARHCIG